MQGQAVCLSLHESGRYIDSGRESLSVKRNPFFSEQDFRCDGGRRGGESSIRVHSSLDGGAEC